MNEPSPSILAEGLDQRRREKVLPAVTVPANSYRDVNVRLSSDLPVQSKTFSTQMHARITYERANQPDTFFLSAPVYVHSNSSYSVFTVYNEAVMRDQFGGGQLTTDASDLQGRVLTDGVWQDIGVLRRLEWTEEGGSGLPPLINGHWWGDFTTMPLPESFTPCSGGSCDAVCAVAENAYVDGGGDYGNFGPTPSCPQCLNGGFELSYARARITRQTTPKCENTSPSPSQNPCIQVVWDGYLDEAGCAQAALDLREHPVQLARSPRRARRREVQPQPRGTTAPVGLGGHRGGHCRRPPRTHQARLSRAHAFGG